MPLNVAIVGGGLGGLCLAQGLHAAGVKVSVYERDRSRTDRLQGFRIGIDLIGSQALYDCLPKSTWEAFLESCGVNRGGFCMGDEQLKAWFEISAQDLQRNSAEGVLGTPYKSVSRITLRQVLLLGLDDVVQFDKEFQNYTQEGDVFTLHFADGSTAEHDVVVGADGTNSRIRKQYLPGCDPKETGVIAIAGKAPLNENNQDMNGFIVYGPQGRSMVMIRHECKQNDASLPSGVGVNDEVQMQTQSGLLFDNTKSYFLWAVLALRPKFGLPEDTKDGTGRLKSKALEMTESWHPAIQQLIKDTEIETVTTWNIRSSNPTPPWPTTRVTVLGDAIHAMPPTGGMGANSALRDAALLCKKLVEANGDKKPLLTAINEYENEMRGYAYPNVQRARRILSGMIEENPWKRGLLSWFLWTLNWTPSWIARRMMGRR